MLNSPIEEIKNRLDILEVLGNYIRLQKAGANWRAICPFHSEKTPSFFVSPARQVWRCFGCSEHGDIFSFVMKIDGVEFGDALRSLAQKAGVELQKASPLLAKMQTEKKRLSEITELAAKFFEKQLFSAVGKEAKEYLEKRGMTEESIASWRLGYAPESASGLFDFLQSKGYREYEVSRAGLLVRSGDQTYDRFRSRIIFPVADINSKIVGFGGRIFGPKAQDKNLAKYLNTSNTPLYDKSRTLYGLDKAKLELRKQDQAVLVEGYVDAVLVSQAGFQNVVAVSGTALTVFHIQILKRYTNNLLLAFDMDLGGDTATRRGIDLAIGEGCSVKVVLMEQGKDPADVVAQNPQLWKNALENAKSIYEFYFATAFARFDKASPEGKKEIASLILPIIKKIPNRIEQSHWVSKLASELRVKEEYVEAELKKIQEEAKLPVLLMKDAPVSRSVPHTRIQLLEERVFVLLCRNPSLVSDITRDKLQLFSIESQEILEAAGKNPEFDFAKFDAMLSQEHAEFLKQMSLEAGVEETEEEDPSLELKECLAQLAQIRLRALLEDISQGIKEAEEGKDAEKLKALVARFKELSKDLHLPR
ncbi:MAG: DNA primase [Candidatus Wildermuthbacteria bacterium]|nr:DNA primase [Candidatus Wildermuthbacteria bacterium]